MDSRMHVCMHACMYACMYVASTPGGQEAVKRARGRLDQHRERLKQDVRMARIEEEREIMEELVSRDLGARDELLQKQRASMAARKDD